MNALSVLLQTLLLCLIGYCGIEIAIADTLAGLPVKGTPEYPVLVLDLGNEPIPVERDSDTTRVFAGEVHAHQGDTAIRTDNEAVTSLHPDFGSWSIGFRFKIHPGRSAGPHRFLARWRQGGDPAVCMQSVEILAGPDSSRLESRATLSMQPKGWNYAWIVGDSPLVLQADDNLIEVRFTGPGHDAKVFDAFMLAPLKSALPAGGTLESPVVLLDLGSAPAFLSIEKDPTLQVHIGAASGGNGAESIRLEKDEAQIFHAGFGSWDADFRFELDPTIAPGQYRLYARYKSGGEASQTEQRFSVRAGPPSPGETGLRAEFTLSNPTPWEYQWLESPVRVAILPGDRRLEIHNSGNADGAKVFDAFALKLESGFGVRMSPEQARLRANLLDLTREVEGAKHRIYILDGPNREDPVLFRALVSSAARPQIETRSLSYLIGTDAEAVAAALKLDALPAALITDDHYTILGVLAHPESEKAVIDFLADPNRSPMVFSSDAETVTDSPQSLRAGMPAAWLVGGLQDGLAGLSVFGLDTERVLRPNPDQPYLSLMMTGGAIQAWREAPLLADGSVDVEADTDHSSLWSRGTGYAAIYLDAAKPVQARLHLKQSGIHSDGWLDGEPFEFIDDPNPPAGFTDRNRASRRAPSAKKLGDSAQGASVVQPEPPQVADLNLSQGAHSLLIKFAMQHDRGERFFFKAQFTGLDGRPLESINTRVSDPSADPTLNQIAAQLRPLVFVETPANLPHPGDPINLRIDLRWHPILEETGLKLPLPRFQAKLILRLVDYDGNEIETKQINGIFPGQVRSEFKSRLETGYYAVYPSLHTLQGKRIMDYSPDGFSVVAGSEAQKNRLNEKKLWNNDYYALADGDKSFLEKGGFFTWLQRIGIFKNYGSFPGFESRYQNQWERAKQLGLILFADSSGDSAWLGDAPEEDRKFMQNTAQFTRFFKSSNEIDIREEAEWAKLRDPAHWVERAKREFEFVHRIRPDGHYVGGSLVRPGDADQAGQWFKAVLRLGLDQYQDAWDVHAYPQHAPQLEGTIGNAESEDERGVLAAYASLTRKNSLPFWLGETGAKAMHGSTGRRWQAEQSAKMIAWANSRANYLGIAFCIAHEYDSTYGRIWDYSMGHKPGEAALYTAGALIDGLPYHRFDTGDSAIQAAYFGETFMSWRTDDGTESWRLKLAPEKKWLLVDVVGRTRELSVDSAGFAEFPISKSPVYVLERAEYDRLTRY